MLMHCGSCSSLERHRPDVFHHTSGFSGTSQTTAFKHDARGATAAPSERRVWLGWPVCRTYDRRFNSRWLPVCLFLVSVYLRLTPCLHVTHRRLPPGHVAEQASFLAGLAYVCAKRIIFVQRFKVCCAFRILPVEELKWLLEKQACVAASASAMFKKPAVKAMYRLKFAIGPC